MELQSAIDLLFDEVIVLSLPTSTDRRDHIARHFQSIGLSTYRLFDAVAADSDQVRDAFAAGRVVRFPPCFRCGQDACGREECNNVLIPAQVANVLSYRAIWRDLVARPRRALLLEDDVLFTPHAARDLAEFARRLEEEGFRFVADLPRLLRLGWALTEEHSSREAVRSSSEVRMSNPCHGITSAFAARLLTLTEQIDTTSDLVTHQAAPDAHEARTIHPPLASELSWSTGAVSSLIHPKAKRSDYLLQQGKPEAAIANDAEIGSHVQHMYRRRYLIVGHPEVGLSETIATMQQSGLDIGDGADGADGFAAWTFAVSDTNPHATSTILRRRATLHWDHLILPVCNLETAVLRVMRLNIESPMSYAFRRRHVLDWTGIDLDSCATNTERAVRSILAWVDMVEALKPDLIFRVEDQAERLELFLRHTAPNVVRTSAHARKAESVTAIPAAESTIDWSALPSDLWPDIDSYCGRYVYQCPDAAALRAPAVPPRSGPTDTHALDTAFLHPSGWSRSLAEQRPVRADGRPLPWFTYGAIEMLHRIVRPTDRVFEYGAGYSTLWWQTAAAAVVSVDHDPEWCAELRPRLASNAVLHQRVSGDPTPEAAGPILTRFERRMRRRVWPDYDPERIVRRGLDDDSFQAYAATPIGAVLPFDIVVIDGMARRLCAEFAVEVVADDGIIILDNANRRDYDAAFDILETSGFRQIPFWGLVPGATFLTCTSLFIRSFDRLAPGGHQPNSFGLREY